MDIDIEIFLYVQLYEESDPEELTDLKVDDGDTYCDVPLTKKIAFYSNFFIFFNFYLS